MKKPTALTAIMGLNPCFNGICAPRSTHNNWQIRPVVLILVLMEYARRELSQRLLSDGTGVLILVLMEYARRAAPMPIEYLSEVLILVLMEYARRDMHTDIRRSAPVLILVLMEYARRVDRDG